MRKTRSGGPVLQGDETFNIPWNQGVRGLQTGTGSTAVDLASVVVCASAFPERSSSGLYQGIIILPIFLCRCAVHYTSVTEVDGW